MSLYRWVKEYKAGKKGIEERIVEIKERKPYLNLREAREILKKEGINISLDTIWRIWTKYAFCGFPKECHVFQFPNFPHLKPQQEKLKKIKFLIKKGNIEKAAKIINSFPLFSDIEILKSIPENILSLKRKVEKWISLFGYIPFPEYCEKIRKLRIQCEEQGLLFTSIWAGIAEIAALDWIGEHEKIIQLIETLEKRIPKDTFFRLPLLIQKGIAYTDLLKFEKAQEIAKIWYRIVMRKKEKVYYSHLSVLYTHLEEYRKAIKLINYSLSDTQEDLNDYPLLQGLIACYITAGEYDKLKKILRKMDILVKKDKREIIKSDYFILKGFIYWLENKFVPAINFVSDSLYYVKERKIIDRLIFTSALLSDIYQSLSETQKAKEILNNILMLSLRYKKLKNVLNIVYLIDKNKVFDNFRPSLKILKLLDKARTEKKIEYYRKAYKIAKSKCILGAFHRYLLFYPEVVKMVIERRKKTYLPPSILKYPIFNRERIIIKINFLGKFKIFKGNNLVKEFFSIKEQSFLIFLAFSKERISLKKIYDNFWPNSKNPSFLLSHILTNIRKKLKIPLYSLKISRKNEMLYKKNIFFLTDYLEFKEKIARAESLLKAGEYEFAKTEFLSAFNLIRGEPFEKMYDRWSEDTRLSIIFELENYIIKFIEEFKKRGEDKLISEIIKKYRKIFKYSDKLNNLPNIV